MAKFEIVGGKPLNGSVVVQGSKNAALPILAASLLCEEQIVIKNVPKITDVKDMLKILSCMGVKYRWQADALIIDAKDAKYGKISPTLSRRIRSSIFLLGSFLSRFKRAELFHPGGCNIGSRPIDLHIKGLRDLGAKIDEKFDTISCDAKSLKSGTVILNFPSVGATENLILASVFCAGTTNIVNAANEPEIVDLANFINAMGGNIEGAGTSVIKVTGVKKLNGCNYKIMPDRIVAGTILIATAMCGGRVELLDVQPCHLIALTSKLRQNCCHIIMGDDKMYISSYGKLDALPKIETEPYPGFPTDLQNQYLALSTISKGSTIISENLFETRFKIVQGLVKMGAKINVSGKKAIVRGVSCLKGCEVYAEDLRGGAAFVIAGLGASGKTIVHNISHIDRGYCRLDQVFKKLGADIKRIE